MEILLNIGSIAGLVAAGLFFIFQKGSQKYVDKKAENLATKEDIQDITQTVETV